jgi:phosphate-selective porin OprO/OprP
MQKRIGLAALTALIIIAHPAFAEDDIKSRITQMEQEIALLKRQLEVSEEKTKTKEEKFANVEYGAKGLTITSPDKRASLRVRGYAQADTRTFFDNSNTGNVDQFLIRTARPIFEATFDKDFAARLMLDFGNNQTRLLDGYVDYKPDSLFNIRLGKFKAPLGLERWQSEQEILFVERGMATNLVPFRDIGLMFYGDLIPQTLEYQIALTNGGVDLADPNLDTDDSKDVSARIFAHPFRNSDVVALQGLGVGVAGSYGKRDGSATNTSVTDGYRTPAQARLFTYRSGSAAADTTFADGTQWRINPQTYYYNGSLGLLGEYVISSQETKRGSTSRTLHHDAFTAVATYVLTGEDASFDGVKPANNFSIKNGNWGAFELTGRYGILDIDNASFPIFADAARSVSEARDITAGLNWYLNNNLKFNFNYSYTTFDGGAAGGKDREDENVLMTRAQFRF